MLIKRKPTPGKFNSPPFRSSGRPRAFALSEWILSILAVIWIGAAALIYYLMQTTLISVLEASRWFILFGLIGFILAYLFRKPLKLSLLDGLYLNVFTIAPLCLVLFLGLNRINSTTYTEEHRILSYEATSDSYVLELEDGAYEEFWRIRNVFHDTPPEQMEHVEYTFGDGRFGYKVLKKTRLY